MGGLITTGDAAWCDVVHSRLARAGPGKIALGRRCRIPRGRRLARHPDGAGEFSGVSSHRPFQCAGQTGGDSHGNRLGNSAAVSRSRGRNRLAWDGLARRGLLRFRDGRMVGSLLLGWGGGETTSTASNATGRLASARALRSQPGFGCRCSCGGSGAAWAGFSATAGAATAGVAAAGGVLAVLAAGGGGIHMAARRRRA